MKLLLDGFYAPITKEIGFIRCSREQAVAAFLEWQNPFQTKRGIEMTVENRSGDLPTALEALLPLTSVERRRMLFLDTASNDWVAFIDNGWQGTDASSQVGYLCRTNGWWGVRAAFAPELRQADRKILQYGATIFELYSPNRTDFLNIERSIFSANDGGRWKFAATGTLQSFEEVEAYDAKRVKDRFTPEMLDRYLQSLGIRFFDPTFYRSDLGYSLVEKTGPSAPQMKTYSLKEARREV